MYRIVQLLAALGYVAFGLLGLFFSVRIVLDLLGAVAAVLSVLLFPVTVAVAPWIPLVREGDPTAVLVVYGGIALSGVLHAVGNAMRRGRAG